MRTLLVRLGAMVLVGGLLGACTDVERNDRVDDISSPPLLGVDDLGGIGLGIGAGDVAAPPRTLSFGDTQVVEMVIGEDAWAPVAISVNAIRRGDVAALHRARRTGLPAPPYAYYVDVTLTFEGLGVIEATPFLTLAEGSRKHNVHHYRLQTQRPFPPCPGTGDDGVTLPAGEAVDVCVVFPGPRPERVRGVSMLDEVGVPTWEGIVS